MIGQSGTTTVTAKTPRIVAKLITAANLVPAGKDFAELPSRWLDFDGSVQGESQAEGKSWRDDVIASAERYLAGLPEGLRNYVGTPRRRRTFIDRWHFIWSARQILGAVIKTTTEHHVDLNEALVQMERDEKGRLRILPGRLFKALDGIDGSRIAQCRWCGRFLWMERKRPDPICSNRCRQAEWRKHHPERSLKIRLKNEEERARKEYRPGKAAPLMTRRRGR